MLQSTKIANFSSPDIKMRIMKIRPCLMRLSLWASLGRLYGGDRKRVEGVVLQGKFRVRPAVAQPAVARAYRVWSVFFAISQGIWLKLQHFWLFPCRPPAKFLEIECVLVEPNMAGRDMDRIRIDRLFGAASGRRRSF
ncbi:hypothetical protein [Rhizobium sp. C1]|uniref:hypothetical protein n=1 Tax=Rhizobium sp. C1 TaxID=1349799 RepID=UPI001E5683B2|nr:hypothetical protein [Rhizobium sp. C1]MCD2176859.1 hypothetical protein [Rhizobium sp. C1]